MITRNPSQTSLVQNVIYWNSSNVIRPLPLSLPLSLSLSLPQCCLPFGLSFFNVGKMATDSPWSCLKNPMDKGTLSSSARSQVSRGTSALPGLHAHPWMDGKGELCWARPGLQIWPELGEEGREGRSATCRYLRYVPHSKEEALKPNQRTKQYPPGEFYFHYIHHAQLLNVADFQKGRPRQRPLWLYSKYDFCWQSYCPLSGGQ